MSFVNGYEVVCMKCGFGYKMVRNSTSLSTFSFSCRLVGELFNFLLSVSYKLVHCVKKAKSKTSSVFLVQSYT